MESWADVQESIDKVIQVASEPEKDQENKDELAEKVERFKAIVEKKNQLVNKEIESKRQLENEVKLMKEVIEVQNKELEDKTKQIEVLDKKIGGDEELVNEAKNVKTQKNKLEKDFDDLRESYNKTKKLNNELEISNSTKEFIIREIKKVRENKDSEDDEVIEVSEGSSNVQMDKNSSGNWCNFCERSFKHNRDLERHINDKHDEHDDHSGDYECTLCGEGFIIESEYNTHVLKCIKTNITISKCPSCKENFPKGALKKHIKKGKCSPNTTNKIRKHITDSHIDEERSKTVCHHWRRGQCFRGDSCMFAHVGFQQQPSGKQFTTKSTNVLEKNVNSKKSCHNGSTCIYLARNMCNYSHQEQYQPRQVQGVNQGGRQGGWKVHGGHTGGSGGQSRGSGGQQVQGGQPQVVRDCWFQERCMRLVCHFNHKSMADFPNIPNQRNQRIQNNGFMRN